MVALWRRANRAERGLHVLLRDGGDHLLGVHALRGHSRRVEPHAHRELRPIHRRIANAWDAQKYGLYVRVDVVGYLQSRQGAVGRANRDEAKMVLGLRADSTAELLHLARQLRLGLRNAVLHLDHVHVAVRFDLERHGKRIGAVVAARARHVEHVVDAVHLVLDRHRDGVQDFLRVRAGVSVVHLDGRRRDARILRYRQLEDGHAAGHGEDDRDDHREARALHESPRKRLESLNRRSK